MIFACTGSSLLAYPILALLRVQLRFRVVEEVIHRLGRPPRLPQLLQLLRRLAAARVAAPGLLRCLLAAEVVLLIRGAQLARARGAARRRGVARRVAGRRGAARRARRETTGRGGPPRHRGELEKLARGGAAAALAAG